MISMRDVKACGVGRHLGRGHAGGVVTQKRNVWAKHGSGGYTFRTIIHAVFRDATSMLLPAPAY